MADKEQKNNLIPDLDDIFFDLMTMFSDLIGDFELNVDVYDYDSDPMCLELMSNCIQTGDIAGFCEHYEKIKNIVEISTKEYIRFLSEARKEYSKKLALTKKIKNILITSNDVSDDKIDVTIKSMTEEIRQFSEELRQMSDLKSAITKYDHITDKLIINGVWSPQAVKNLNKIKRLYDQNTSARALCGLPSLIKKP